MLKNDTSQEKGQEPLRIRNVKHHSVMVLTVQHFFSLSPSLKIIFLKPRKFLFLFFFTDKQSKYRNNLQRCSADIFPSSVCVFSFQPKGRWRVCFVLKGTFELHFTYIMWVKRKLCFQLSSPSYGSRVQSGMWYRREQSAQVLKPQYVHWQCNPWFPAQNQHSL